MPVFLGDKWALYRSGYFCQCGACPGVFGKAVIFMCSFVAHFRILLPGTSDAGGVVFSLLGIGKREGRIRKTVCRRRDSGFSLASGKALRQGER